MTLHVSDKRGALQAEAGRGSIGAADTTAGIAEGLFDLFAGKRRDDGASPRGSNWSGRNLRARGRDGGGGAEFGGRNPENAMGGEDNGALDDVLQFADVSRPVVAYEGAHRVRRNGLN